MLSCSHSLFSRLLKGNLGKRSHLLITYSFLLLWSTERTDKLGKVLCDQKIWKVCLGQRWVDHGCAWFKVSYSIALLKWQDKRGLLQRALPCLKLLTQLALRRLWRVETYIRNREFWNKFTNKCRMDIHRAIVKCIAQDTINLKFYNQ